MMLWQIHELMEQNDALNKKLAETKGELQDASFSNDELTIFSQNLCTRNAQIVKDFGHLERNAEEREQQAALQLGVWCVGNSMFDIYVSRKAGRCCAAK